MTCNVAFFALAAAQVGTRLFATKMSADGTMPSQRLGHAMGASSFEIR